jgi:hypothetical protein
MGEWVSYLVGSIEEDTWERVVKIALRGDEYTTNGRRKTRVANDLQKVRASSPAPTM